MQFTLSALTLAVATTASAVTHHKHPKDEYNIPRKGFGRAMVVNRCSYPVYLWSIDKEQGCPEKSALKLETGDFYTEEMHDGEHGDDGGISIKISKSTTCAPEKITQLEYKLNMDPKYPGNYLDMSFVNCLGDLDACPGRTDGYYLQSGNQNGLYPSSDNNKHCPIHSISSALQVPKVAYILPFDDQTKWCDNPANLSLYLCGGEAPDGDAHDLPQASEPKPSSKVEEKPKPSSKVEEKPEPTPEAEVEVKKLSEPTPEVKEETKPTPVEEPAVVTPAPVKPPVIKTEVVYVTKFVKRHGHARRHHH